MSQRGDGEAETLKKTVVICRSNFVILFTGQHGDEGFPTRGLGLRVVGIYDRLQSHVD